MLSLGCAPFGSGLVCVSQHSSAGCCSAPRPHLTLPHAHRPNCRPPKDSMGLGGGPFAWLCACLRPAGDADAHDAGSKHEPEQQAPAAAVAAVSPSGADGSSPVDVQLEVKGNKAEASQHTSLPTCPPASSTNITSSTTQDNAAASQALSFANSLSSKLQVCRGI